MKKEYLVGSTGFVGSNLAEEHMFTRCFHSTDIEEAYGERPDLLVYAGIPAEMYLASHDPQADWNRIQQAMQNIQKIAPKQIVLISTIAVYSFARGVDENTPIHTSEQSVYGANRYALEQWVEKNYPVHLIVRLPALFGKNLKKNFLYDFIHLIPTMLKRDKFEELVKQEPGLTEYYTPKSQEFLVCRDLAKIEQEKLKGIFRQLGFSALNFTDSRSRYQFYDLKRLWKHIEYAMELKIEKLNISTPPVEVRKLYQQLTGQDFINELPSLPFDYDFRSRYATAFGGKDGYLLSWEEELADIRQFLKEQGANDIR